MFFRAHLLRVAGSAAVTEPAEVRFCPPYGKFRMLYTRQFNLDRALVPCQHLNDGLDFRRAGTCFSVPATRWAALRFCPPYNKFRALNTRQFNLDGTLMNNSFFHHSCFFMSNKWNIFDMTAMLTPSDSSLLRPLSVLRWIQDPAGRLWSFSGFAVFRQENQPFL